jgi:hypothetical protein
MENSFKSIIDQSKSILIILPTKPYLDQVAAGLGLFLSLRDKKDISIYSPSPMTVEFNRLVGVNKVTGEMGNKNLMIRFLDYRASDIERVSYDIEDSQFRLTVIPKQRVAPPAKDQVDLSYSGVSADTVILIGGANETHFPAISLKELTSANIVHIGIKDLSFSSNKSYFSFAKPASSICEVTADLIKESGLLLDQDVATNLLAGIEKTTNNFTEGTVTGETFAVIAELMKSGGKRVSDQPVVQSSNFPPGAIPGQFPRPSFQQPMQQFQPQPFQGNWPQPKFPQQQFPQPQPRVNPQVNPAPWPPAKPAQTVPVQPQPPVQSQSQTQSSQSGQSDIDESQAPSDWLQPKIYKGTPVS